MKKGKLIVIEGASDGIGKSTQFELLKKRLEQDGKTIINHHFPTYNEYQGKMVEEYLKGNYGNVKELSPYFVNSLYAVDRAVTCNLKLKEGYENGKFILLDRYTSSSLIYQSALIEDIEEKKKFLDYVIDFEYNKLDIIKPDNTIFLYAPLEIINEMRRKRKEEEGEKFEGDIHENDLKFMKKVYDSALFVADYLNWTKINCSKDNKIKSIEEIHEEIYKVIKETI